ncbi:MAG: diaminopimelate decarboxylase [Firmicutes bacterium]|nr:diaminopimelate decarboxylase [Bacillota bacterium]
MKDPRFFQNIRPEELADTYATPLYVYNERVFRTRCREMKNLVTYPNFTVHYSVKANSNLTLLKIAREEGLHVDAMSPGEIYVEEKAGFLPEEIFYISNNVSIEEMAYAVERGICVSLDSISQLRRFAAHFPGASVSLRINTGIGAGHSEKVVTGGKKTKFAIPEDQLNEAVKICREASLRLKALNQHIGSFFLDGEIYLEGVKALLAAAEKVPGLELIDLGGGFGMPYDEKTQKRLDLSSLGRSLDQLFADFSKKYAALYPESNGKEISFAIEPGRYISAESCVLLGRVHAIKENAGHLYCGTDIGFNVLMRPVLYDSYHKIETWPVRENAPVLSYTVVGNICESGDILAKDRELPQMEENDLVIVCDAGAYGYSMASNYNNRLRPAEVLIGEDDQVRLIRRRDTLEDLVRGFES